MASITPIASTVVFIGTAFIARQCIRRRALHHLTCNDSFPVSLKEADAQTQEQVERNRSSHVSKSCSVSYANSGALQMQRGEGSRLFDINGIGYLDTRNNVAHVGHSHPKVAQAVAFQVQLLNTNTRYLHPNSSLLAKKLADLLPSPLEVVFFVNSGSEANDLALRLARAYKCSQSADERLKKQHVISVDHAYHGHTLAVLDVSPYKHHQGDEMTCPGHVKIVSCPDLYRGEHSLPINANNDTDDALVEDAASKYAAHVEAACDEITSSGNSVSAFIIEGGMSVAGVILPPKSYLKTCIEAVHTSGGLYIADEVQTGFGRLGKCMWAFQHSMGGNDSDICPDIVTVGKPFGNGMPLAAVITTRQIASSFESLGVEYFNTFGGNPVCCAAGLAMLDVLSSEGLQNNALTVGSYLQQRFCQLQSRQELIGDIRGCGLFLGIELVKDKITKEPATVETSFICSILKEKYHVLTSVDGFHENVIVIKPPMCFSKADAEEFVSCFEKVLVEDLPAASERLAQMKRTPT
ncbi:hypothetical protein ACHAWO_011017 [Cyclotella atomus]|uniref:Uncharacterized protein n=1 Tax=Cyclotella atomus TaxID=382360 RepID=A0ABD3P5B8_9STRA